MVADIPGVSSARLPAATALPTAHAMPTGGSVPVGALGGVSAGGWSMSWVGLDSLLLMPEDADKKLLDAASKAADLLANDMQEYAYENAPWQDDTGDARAGLLATVEQHGDVFVITLGYTGVDYGIYLENDNGGQYAIVGPTLEKYARQMGQYISAAVS